ncbi:MAG: thiamine kinase-like enzyme [Gammaproteobacteria bacterium]|jgi:thiamine kinase-like enzyme
MNEEHLSRIIELECWQSVPDISPLAGGMTNVNYRVTDGDKQYVARLGDDDPVHLISRNNEIATNQAAFEAGLSPELIYHQPGIQVVRFIEGKVFEESDVRQPDNLHRIVTLIKTFHRKVPDNFRQVPVMFWVFQVLRHYRYLLNLGQSRHRNKLADLESRANQLEKAVGPVDIVFGHNDLLPANIIDDGERLWIIDFDYAGFNSPIFDLANLASNNELNTEQEITMLEQYFGSALNRVQWTSYYAMKCASLLRETMWSMVSEVHSDIDFDYVDYTQKNLNRFESTFQQFEIDYC